MVDFVFVLIFLGLFLLNKYIIEKLLKLNVYCVINIGVVINKIIGNVILWKCWIVFVLLILVVLYSLLGIVWSILVIIM